MPDVYPYRVEDRIYFYARQLAEQIATSYRDNPWWHLDSFIPAGSFSPVWTIIFKNNEGAECRVTVEDIPGETPVKSETSSPSH